MTRLMKLVLIFLSVSLSIIFQINQAVAGADVECIRKTRSTAGFVSVRAFDAWFPKTVYFQHSSATPKETDRLRYTGRYQKLNGVLYNLAPNITWEMLPDGRLFGMLEHKAGFVLVTPVRYLCDAAVDEVLGNR